MIKQWFIKMMKASFICMILLSLCRETVHASEINNGSIRIHCSYDESVELSIEDQTFQIIQIATYNDGRYVYRSEFTSLNRYDENMPSIEKNQLAKQIHAMIQKKGMKYDRADTVDANGYAMFEPIDLGLYLISKVENEHLMMDPFLIHLPFQMEDGLVYSLNIEPKFEYIEDDVLPPEDQEIPETGVMNCIPLYSISMVLSLLVSITIIRNIQFELRAKS